MARGFGTVSGVAATDSIVTNVSTYPTAFTWAMDVFLNSGGPNGFGRLIDTTDSVFNCFWSYAAGQIALTQRWNGVEFRWAIQGSNTFNTLQRILIRYDRSNVANNMTAFRNGVAAVITNPATRTGVAGVPTGNMILGNRNDAGRNLDGWMARVACWDHEVPDWVGIAYTSGQSPIEIYPDGLYYYNPLIRDPIDLIGGATHTVNGTAVLSHPRCFNV